jgi:hypothetical protein
MSGSIEPGPRCGRTPVRILLTDGDYKHCIAIQRYLYQYFKSITVLVHIGRSVLYASLGRDRRSELVTGDLVRALERVDYDLVIPVGAKSVSTVAEVCPDRAVLPSRAAIGLCFDKLKTVDLASSHGVPHPRTWAPQSLEHALDLDVPFPCVIKSRHECQIKLTLYAHSRDEFVSVYRKAYELCIGHGFLPPIIQEYFSGVGAGLFALYNKGVAKRIFMHRRIREWPITGGASTAAATFYHPVLHKHGVKLLDALRWHGVAMVEFKFDPVLDRFCLMEINPKFWGSTELALRAGVNFPAELVRIFQGEEIGYSEGYDRNLRFYWPLPDDLRALRAMGKLHLVREYFQEGSCTNLFRRPMLQFINLGRFFFR